MTHAIGSVTGKEKWTRRKSLVVYFALIAMLFMCPQLLRAQENATITGTVLDATGAVVPNAEISITNPATKRIINTVSNSSGIYSFTNVGIGHWTLHASVPGFQKYTKTDIVVNVAQTLEENITLSVGSQALTVTVQADALQVQTETSEVSNLISGEQVTQLATNGRNVTGLAALGMGVSSTLSDFGGVNALTASNSISFNGTRSEHNIYLLDGGELNDRGCGGCFSSLPTVDALAEFQTLDSNYQPDYGDGSGGTILMVIKSGTHDFHGSLWEFNRNDDYNANNYFTKRAGEGRSEFKLNEPGGTIGGPLWIPHVYNNARNKTFFFWNEEWRRLIEGSSPTTMNTIAANNFPTANTALAYTVPSGGATPIVPATTDPNKLAIYAANGLTAKQPFPNNVIPASLIDQNAVLELNSNTFPKPNLGTNQYISSVSQPTFVREDLGRIDHAFNSKYQLMGHYVHDAVTQTYYPPLWDTSNVYPTVGTAMTNPSYAAAIKLTQTYSPSLLNETAFFYSGNKLTLSPVAGSGTSYAQPSGWTATTFFPIADNRDSRMPEIDLVGSPLDSIYTTSYFPWKNGYEGFNYRDDVSWTKGRHQFKFGFTWLHAYKNQELQANTQGTAVFNSSQFSGDSYVNFLLGDATSFTQLELLLGKHWVSNNYSFYGNDNWHISPRLTLNLGVRFDAIPHTFERYNKFANFVPADYSTSLGSPLNSDGTLNSSYLTTYNGEQFYLNGIKEAGVDGFPHGNVKNVYNTWEPRVGFAYDLAGNGKTVIRGGFGMFYERVQGNDVYNAAQDPPFAYQPSATNVYFSNPNTSALTGVTTSQSFPSTLTNIKYNYPPPGSAMYSLGAQRELAPSVVAVLQYVGTIGWDQNNDRAINTLPLVDSNSSYATRKGVADGSLNSNLYRQYPGYSSITQEENESNSNYNSLQAGLRLENRHGLTLQLAYTWSHEIDDVLNQQDLSNLSNPFNPRYDRASGAMDRRHIFNANYIYAFPLFKRSRSILARETLGGWEFSGTTVAESGTPQYIYYTGTDTLGLGGGMGGNRPNLLSKVSYPKKVGEWFSTSSFGDPTAPWNGGSNQGFGNAGRDAVVLPGRLNFNWSLFKTIPLTSSEGPKIELRFESFNIFNHTQFHDVDSNTADSNFGQVTDAYDPRVLQFGAKFSF
jgi:hypothetical protein